MTAPTMDEIIVCRYRLMAAAYAKNEGGRLRSYAGYSSRTLYPNGLPYVTSVLDVDGDPA